MCSTSLFGSGLAGLGSVTPPISLPFARLADSASISPNGGIWLELSLNSGTRARAKDRKGLLSGSSPIRKCVKRQFPRALRRGAKPARTTEDLPLPEAPTSAVRLCRSTRLREARNGPFAAETQATILWAKVCEARIRARQYWDRVFSLAWRLGW